MDDTCDVNSIKLTCVILIFQYRQQMWYVVNKYSKCDCYLLHSIATVSIICGTVLHIADAMDDSY